MKNYFKDCGSDFYSILEATAENFRCDKAGTASFYKWLNINRQPMLRYEFIGVEIKNRRFKN